MNYIKIPHGYGHILFCADQEITDELLIEVFRHINSCEEAKPVVTKNKKVALPHYVPPYNGSKKWLSRPIAFLGGA